MKFNLPTSHVETIGKARPKWKCSMF